MDINFSFIELSFNPTVNSITEVEEFMTKLGFTFRTVHQSGKFGMWNQNRTIVFTRQTERVQTMGVTGLGFICDADAINNSGAKYDDETEMYVLTSPNGLRMLLVSDFMFNENDRKYVIVDNSVHRNPGIKCFGGVVINSTLPEHVIESFYKRLGFTLTKRDTESITLVSNNKRFTILINRSDDSQLRSIICETDDVFATTAGLIVKGVKFKNYELDKNTLDFGTLTHKIVAYNCMPFGNSSSYSIENLVPNGFPGVDIIVRMRKQYLHLVNENVKRHYV